MNGEAFRRHGHVLVDWIADYLEHSDRYPVLARVKPGEIAAALPTHAPEEPEPFDAIMADVERILVPGLTHWNHPRFLAYFATSGSPPGVLAEFLSAAFNQQAMLWRTSPVATELEYVALAWLRRLIGLPDAFEGVIYDTASIATLHALAAARHAAVPGVRPEGLAGRPDVGRLAVYCSEQAHSSVDKAAITLGLGDTALRKIAVDDEFRMRADRARRSDPPTIVTAGVLPVAVVATVGTTATTSIDPVPDIAAICERERIWLHVDAAYGGAAAMLPSHAHVLDGAARADSLVVNPHKWLFTPFDLSAFYCRRMDLVRSTFSVIPDFLRTPEPEAQKPDGHRDPAGPALSRAQALDGPAIVRSARDSGASGPALALGSSVRGLGRRRRRFRTRRPGAVFRGLFPVESRRTEAVRRRRRRGQRTAGRDGESGQERYFFPTRGCAAVSRSGWRSATCVRRRRTSAGRGNS